MDNIMVLDAAKAASVTAGVAAGFAASVSTRRGGAAPVEPGLPRRGTPIAAVTTREGWHPSLVWPWTVLSFVIVLVAMEPYSAWVHRVVWHGPLWSMHRSHHRERIGSDTRGELVANDALSASHAPVSMALITWGFFSEGVAASIAMGAGLGLGVFGLLYVVFHDGMVHGRLPVEALARFRFLAAIKDAHERHHRKNGAPYGFFASPLLSSAKRAADDAGQLLGRRAR